MRNKGIDTEFVIIGRAYGTEQFFYDWDKKKEFPYYKEMEHKEFVPEGVASLGEAEEWLLDNHPEFYFGCNIYERYKEHVPTEEREKSLDFFANAVPSYYEELYQTKDRNKLLDIAKLAIKNRIFEKEAEERE